MGRLMKDKEEKVRTLRREKRRGSSPKHKGRSPGWGVFHTVLSVTGPSSFCFSLPTHYTPFSPRNSIKSNVSTKSKRKSVALRLDMAAAIGAIHTRKSCTSRQFLTRWPFQHVRVWFSRMLCKESETGTAQSLLLCHEAQSKQSIWPSKLDMGVI